MPFILAQIDEHGVLDARTHSGMTLHGNRRCVALFNNAGIPSAYEASILLWLRCHTPMCVAIEGVCFTAEQHKSGATWSESMMAARAVHAGRDIETPRVRDVPHF